MEYFAQSVESVESKSLWGFAYLCIFYITSAKAWKSLLQEPKGPLQSSDLPPKPPPSPLEAKHRRLLAVGLEAQGDRNGQEWTGDGDMMHGKSHVCQPSLITAAGQGTVQIIFYLLLILLCFLFPAWRHSWSIRHQSCDMDECMKGRKAKSRNSITTAFQEVPTFVLSHCLIVLPPFNFFAPGLARWMDALLHTQVGGNCWRGMTTNPAWTISRFDTYLHMACAPLNDFGVLCSSEPRWGCLRRSILGVLLDTETRQRVRGKPELWSIQCDTTFRYRG